MCYCLHRSIKYTCVIVIVCTGLSCYCYCLHRSIKCYCLHRSIKCYCLHRSIKCYCYCLHRSIKCYCYCQVWKRSVIITSLKWTLCRSCFVHRVVKRPRPRGHAAEHPAVLTADPQAEQAADPIADLTADPIAELAAHYQTQR